MKTFIIGSLIILLCLIYVFFFEKRPSVAYVCHVGCEFTDIQIGIDSDKDVVFLAPEEFVITKLLDTKKNQKIIGSGVRNTILKVSQ